MPDAVPRWSSDLVIPGADRGAERSSSLASIHRRVQMSALISAGLAVIL
jgi:hypothetical protein